MVVISKNIWKSSSKYSGARLHRTREVEDFRQGTKQLIGTGGVRREQRPLDCNGIRTQGQGWGLHKFGGGWKKG